MNDAKWRVRDLDIPSRTVNYLCDRMGFPRVGTGKSREFSRDDVVIIMIAHHLTDILTHEGMVQRIESLRKLKPDFKKVKTICWSDSGCTINKTPKDEIVTYTLHLNRLLAGRINEE